MYNNYKKDLEYGQMKERVTLNVMREVYGLEGISDNESNKHDIVLNNSCICEVKADKYIKGTRNIWLEYCGNIQQDHEGWLIYSDCQLLAYHVVEPSEPYRTIKILFLDFRGLKHYVENEYFDGDFSNPESMFANTAMKKNAKAILIPPNEFQQFVICVYSTLEKREIYINPSYSSLKDFTESIAKVCPLSA